MQSAEDVEREIIKELQTVTENGAEITPTTNISRDLGLDSLAIMNFMMRLEDEFDLSIPLEKISEVETVADLASMIFELKAKV